MLLGLLQAIPDEPAKQALSCKPTPGVIDLPYQLQFTRGLTQIAPPAGAARQAITRFKNSLK